MGCLMVNVIRDQVDPVLKQGDCVMVESTIDIQPGNVFCHLWHNQPRFKRLVEGVNLYHYWLVGRATKRIINLVRADEGLGTPQVLQA